VHAAVDTRNRTADLPCSITSKLTVLTADAR